MWDRLEKTIDDLATPKSSSAVQSEDMKKIQLAFYRGIRLFCTVFAVFGFLAGIVLSVFLFISGATVWGIGGAPFIFGLGGVAIGLATACLFAPNVFFDTPDGKQWLQLIGMKTAFGARMVCLFFLLLLIGIVLYFTLIAPHSLAIQRAITEHF